MPRLILPWMVRQGPQQHVTDPYVSVPPALTITDETGAIWTLGFQFGEAPRGEFAFIVLRNGLDTGEVASRIERYKGHIRIFTAQGWKQLFTVKTEDALTAYGIGVRLTRALRPDEDGPITVRVAREGSDQVLAHVAFNPHHPAGHVEDLRQTPVVCAPGQWLQATVTPARPVQVMACLGGTVLREIPIV